MTYSGRRKTAAKSAGNDYSVYRFSTREYALYLMIYLFLDGLVSLLFYRSFAAFAILLPGAWLYLKVRRAECRKKRLLVMQSEFLSGMQFVSTALQAGYAVENAFREAEAELGRIYAPSSFIRTEMRYLNSQVRLNVPLEGLLLDLGERTQAEDIMNFAEVFSVARRSGGDLISIVRNTVSQIRQKSETRGEIETMLAGKRMEQRLMSLIPLFILGYVGVTSPGFFDSMYHTITGTVIMTALLLVYAAAYYWGEQIMSIQV